MFIYIYVNKLALFNKYNTLNHNYNLYKLYTIVKNTI